MHAEAHVAEALGVSRDQIRSARALLKGGRDFVEAHGEIGITEAGLRRLLVVLKCQTPEKDVAAAVALIAQNARGGAIVAAAVSSPAKEGDRGAGVEPGAEAGEKEGPVVRGIAGGMLLQVTRPTRNHQLVMAVVCAQPSLGEVRLRVRDNENWTEGLLCRASLVDGDLWEFEGPMPRSRGRW